MFTIKVKQSRPPCQGGRLDGYKSYNILQDLLFFGYSKNPVFMQVSGIVVGQNVGG